MSAYTLEKITMECAKIAKDNGYTLDTRVALNGRLRTTLGRVKYVRIAGVLNAEVIEFSKAFVENATDEQVLGTIRHEMAHWLASTSSGEQHGHDVYWKKWCLKVGADPTALYDSETNGELNEKACIHAEAKYFFYCSECGKLVAKRTRACNLTKNTNEYLSNCCKAALRMEG